MADAKAVLRFVRMTPRKVRLVIDLIRSLDHVKVIQLDPALQHRSRVWTCRKGCSLVANRILEGRQPWKTPFWVALQCLAQYQTTYFCINLLAFRNKSQRSKVRRLDKQNSSQQKHRETRGSTASTKSNFGTEAFPSISNCRAEEFCWPPNWAHRASWTENFSFGSVFPDSSHLTRQTSNVTLANSTHPRSQILICYPPILQKIIECEINST